MHAHTQNCKLPDRMNSRDKIVKDFTYIKKPLKITFKYSFNNLWGLYMYLVKAFSSVLKELTCIVFTRLSTNLKV